MLKRIFSMLAVIGLLLVPIREAAAQDGNLKGLVQDETGAPIAGAFVTVKGETRGVMTDEDGHFQISIKPTDVLIFSFLIRSMPFLQIIIVKQSPFHGTHLQILRSTHRFLETMSFTALPWDCLFPARFI